MSATDVARIVVAVGAGLATVLALSSWSVTSRRVNAGSAVGRALRGISDPVMVPIERWLLQRGQNPQDAPWWLLGLAVAGGIVVLTVVPWLGSVVGRGLEGGRAGPRGIVRLVVYLTGQLVLLSLIVRVVASWMGKGRFTRWLRPAFWLTDWIVEPMRRIIPPLGIIDLVPLVAWFLLQILLAAIVGAI